MTALEATPRFGKLDWIEVGFRLLAAEGPGALTLERLTQQAGRTRGSFYHHFKDREDFVRELMAEWRERSTEQAARRMAEIADVAALRRVLLDWPISLDHALEKAIRRMAVTEPKVREMLAEMDRRRIEGFAALVAGARPEIADPASFALLAYSVIVGAQWLLEHEDPRGEGLRAAGEALFWPES
jgi:AcrR family transcriptional regulator